MLGQIALTLAFLCALTAGLLTENTPRNTRLGIMPKHFPHFGWMAIAFYLFYVIVS
jgi:hypothetical protein